MSSRALNHRRTHNILLLKKVLEARDGASPFTLVLDSVEQAARGLVRLCGEGEGSSVFHCLSLSLLFCGARGMFLFWLLLLLLEGVDGWALFLHGIIGLRYTH